MSEEIFLQTVDVYKKYHAGSNIVSVLDGVDFSVFRNEWVAILGSSGSGKTTLLNILGALDVPDKGDISCAQRSYGTMTEKEKTEFRLNKIGFVFQAYHMFPELSILENVKLPAMIKKSKSGFKQRALELLDQVGLGDRIHHKPSELSGGEQQRAAIARALINDPELILADEPTGNLDSHTGEQILEIFQNLHELNEGRTIIMISHDMHVADYADRKIVLKDGRVTDAL